MPYRNCTFLMLLSLAALRPLGAAADGPAECEEGIAAAEAGDQNAAIGHFDRCLREAQLSTNARAEFYNRRGVAYATLARLDRAIADFTQAVGVDPTYAQAYYNRGTAYGRKGQLDEAIAEFDEALRLDPRYVLAFHGRAVAHLRQRAYDRAIADEERALALDPASVDANNGLAWLLATAPEPRWRDGARAVALAEKAVAARPSDPGFLDTLAAAYAEAGRFPDAIETQQKAVALLQDQGRGDQVADFQRRLSRYQQGKPWRD